MSDQGKVQIRFLGAAQTVTGSRYLLSYQGKHLMIDCGLFQGLKSLRLQNWDSESVPAKTIDAVVLTHAHIDHSGYIPRLIKDGYTGKVYCTPATLALCKILLPDAGYLQEEEAEYLNRKKISKHHPALPLFSRKDAESSLARLVPINFHESFEPVPGFSVRFLYAGHILGAAMVIVKVGGKTIAFSGDLGRLQDDVFRAPEILPHCDYLLIESTYGDRKHPDSNPLLDLGEMIQRAAKRNGVILIPAFAVGRTQTLLYFLSELKKSGRLPDIPMYLNSPMATNVTETLCQFTPLHKLSAANCLELRDIVHYVGSSEESKKLNTRHGPMLIIAGSGMATGGRILHHLKAFASDPKNMIVLTGFQAAGTRGQALRDGVSEIKIHGQYVPIRAEVCQLENLSAHADYTEMLSWLETAKIRPKKVFVVHGEHRAADQFRVRLQTQFEWSVEVPEQNSIYNLE